MNRGDFIKNLFDLDYAFYKYYKLEKAGRRFFNKRRGYILSEVFYSICIASIVMIIVSTAATISTTELKRIDERIELSEQFNEIKHFVSRDLKNANNIKFYNGNKQIVISEEPQYVDKIRTNEFSNDRLGIIESEVSYISINNSNKKIYIQKRGGKYEIGNYIKNMKVVKNMDGRTYNIEIELKKGNSLYADGFSIRTKNLLI